MLCCIPRHCVMQFIHQMRLSFHSLSSTRRSQIFRFSVLLTVRCPSLFFISRPALHIFFHVDSASTCVQFTEQSIYIWPSTTSSVHFINSVCTPRISITYVVLCNIIRSCRHSASSVNTRCLSDTPFLTSDLYTHANLSHYLPFSFKHVAQCHTYRKITSPTYLVSRTPSNLSGATDLLYWLYVLTFWTTNHVRQLTSVKYYVFLHGHLTIIPERLIYSSSSSHVTCELLPIFCYMLVYFLLLPDIPSAMRHVTRRRARSHGDTWWTLLPLKRTCQCQYTGYHWRHIAQAFTPNSLLL